MRRSRTVIRFMICAGLSCFAVGCHESPPFEPDGDMRPVTEMNATVVPLTEESYILEVDWKGVDRDGEVVAFEYAFDDTAVWSKTSRTESSFEFRRHREGSDGEPEGESDILSEYHTLFARAVDDEGYVDPTPSQICFNPLSVGPTTVIIRGPNLLSGRSVRIEWEGFDPDDPSHEVSAYDYFHTTISVLRSDYGYVDDRGVTKKLWSALDWIRVGADSTFVILRDLETGYGPGGGNRHFFGVRAADGDGAVDMIPKYGDNFRIWGAVEEPLGNVIIRSNIMGTRATHGPGSDPVSIFEGARVVFAWHADLQIYDGVVAGYAHAYDNLLFTAWDLEDTRFPAEGGFIPVRGGHCFFVRALDDADLITEAAFPFQVLPGPGDVDETEVLMIQDFHVEGEPEFYPTPEKYRAFWEDSLLVNFNSQIHDPREEGDPDPPIQKMAQASTIIVSFDDFPLGGGSSRQQMAIWHETGVNPLWSYVDAGGNLLICGFFPGWIFLPDNDFTDTGTTPLPDPCFWWSTPSGCGNSLIWYNPLVEDSIPQHPLFEFCAVETTWLDENEDFLWSARAEQPFLPDLHVDSSRSRYFENQGLHLCERLTHRSDRPVEPLYSFSRSGDPADGEGLVGIWIPSPDGHRGDVVYLGMPLYYFEPAEAKALVEGVLVGLFGESMIE